jgi:hypothetical protein
MTVEPKIRTAEPKVAGSPIIPIYEFVKEDKIQTITRDELQMSIRRESGLAGIRNIPVQYWTLYSILLTALEEHKLNFTEKDIIVQANSSRAYLTDLEKSAGYDNKRAPINRWRFDKIISTIQLPNIMAGSGGPAEDVRNAAIGLTVNKEGIMVSFGMNLHVCENFNVLGGTCLRSYTYGKEEGLAWELMLHKIKGWIKNINQIWTVQNSIMKTMKEFTLPVDIAVIEELVGDLYLAAIKQAYFKGGYTPFDTHELSNFVKEMIQSRKNEETLATVWDVYNWGTSIMKPGIVDIGEIANNSSMWSDYLLNRFEMQIPDAIIVE